MSDKIFISGIKNTIEVKTKHKTYDVVMLQDEWRCDVSAYSKVLIVTNENIAPLYLELFQSRLIAQEVHTHILKDGEEHKTWDSIKAILDSAFISKLDRKSLMIAVGGGVVSDLVGFASGIYQRGIDFISFPTTLLAQVDASVGGKCGINNEFGKNLIGLFHQPAGVFVWMGFLASLPEREKKAGIAEIIKIAACFDGDFFKDLENMDLWDDEILSSCIFRAIEIKAKVVILDEQEKGVRAALNYGHTFGHVIELLGNYKQFLHGEAVAIGMRMANSLSLQLGKMSKETKERIDSLLDKNAIKFSYKIEDKEVFYQNFFMDKKVEFGKLRVILLRDIGDFEICSGIDKTSFLKALEEWSR